MNRSHSKIRHIQESNILLEQRILNERIGVKLTPESLNTPKANDTKQKATFLNSYYKINLSSAKTGSWTDKDYNDTLKKFMEEKGIPVWVCKKGDGFCNDESEGEITTQEINKLNQAMVLPTTNISKNEGWLTYQTDKNYGYKKVGENWVAKNLKTNQEYNLTQLSKQPKFAGYKQTIANLEKTFPGGKSPTVGS